MIMLRSLVAISLVVGLFTAPPFAQAQQAGKIHRVGHLSGSAEATSQVTINAFREGMRALGYVEGQNWVLDARFAEGRVERLASLAQELIDRKPDVLLVSTTPGILAAKAATSTIPIVMVLVSDPVGTGVVPSLARPGGNIEVRTRHQPQDREGPPVEDPAVGASAGGSSDPVMRDVRSEGTFGQTARRG